MAKILIPQPLRRLTNDTSIISTDASTLADAVDGLEQQYPGIKERICDEQGEIRRFVNIYINGEDVRFLEALRTPLKPADEVSIVPAVAGGAHRISPPASPVRYDAA